MPVPSGKVAGLKTAVYEQVESGLVLQVERAQGYRHVQAVQAILFDKKALSVVCLQPDGQIYIRQRHSSRIIDTAKQIQIHQMGMVRLAGCGMQLHICFPLNGQQLQVRLLGQPVFNQLPDNIYPVLNDGSDRIRKSHLRFVEQAEQVLFCHGTFQLMSFHTDAVVGYVCIDFRLLLCYLVRTSPQKRLCPSHSGMEGAATLAQIVAVIIRS